MTRLFIKFKQFILSTFFLLLMLKTSALSLDVFKIAGRDDINFKYDVALVVFQGKFRIKSSYLSLDKKFPENSEFTLAINLSTSSAGFAFATRVMLGQSVLHAEKYPEIIFKSENISYFDEKFEILGQLTIKNITRDLQLIATPIGFKPDNFSDKTDLNFHIFGEINRHDFGASAFPGLVGSIIVLDSIVTVTPVLS